MDVSFSAQRSSMYQVAVVPLSSGLAHSVRKLSIATREKPDHICGQALRVGYTGPKETDLALYRLKVRPGTRLLAITLPGFFVLESGIFRVYER